MKRIWLSAAMGAIASAFLMAPAQAAPIGVTKIAATSAGVAKAHYTVKRYHRYRVHRHRAPVLKFYKHTHKKYHHRRWR